MQRVLIEIEAPELPEDETYQHECYENEINEVIRGLMLVYDNYTQVRITRIEETPD